MTFYGRIRIRIRKIWPDPDPRKRSGSDRIRIRNTVIEGIKKWRNAACALYNTYSVTLLLCHAASLVRFRHRSLPSTSSRTKDCKKTAWSKTPKRATWVRVKNYHFGHPKKCIFGFWRKTPKLIFSSCFGFDSALKTIDAHVFSWSVIFENDKKKFFCEFLKILTYIEFVHLLFLKLKQKKNMKIHFVVGFYFKTQKLPIFWIEFLKIYLISKNV